MAVRVRQRPDKPGWWIFIDHQGKQKKKHFADKETARKIARKIRERLALGDFNLAEKQPEPKPFITAYKMWLETYVKNHTKGLSINNSHNSERVLPLSHAKTWGGSDFEEKVCGAGSVAR